MTSAPAGEPGAARRGATALAGALVIAAWSTLVLLEPSWTARLAAGGFDAWQVLSPRQVVSMPATVVAIDEKSIATLGRWPWPRTRLAELIDAIQQHRPAAIGLDIFMPEPDPLSPERVLAHAVRGSPGRQAELAALPSNDSVLARSLASAPAVLAVAGMPAPTGMRMRVAPFAVQDSAAGSDAGEPAQPPLEHHAGVLASVDEIDRAASGWGLISVDREGGVIRRIPLAASIDGTLVPAFAIETLRVALRIPSLRLVMSGPAVQGIAIGNVFVRTEGDGNARIHFSRRLAARFVPAVDVLEGRVDPSRFARHVVLVGVTGLGLGEYHATPLGESMPGSEIHAQLLENVFDDALLVRPPWAPAAEAMTFALLGTLLVWAVPAVKPRNAALLAIVCVAVLAAAAFAAFRGQRLVLDAATPAVGLAVLFGVLLLSTLAEAARQRRALERVVQAQREQSARMAGELEAARRIQTATLPTTDLVREDPRLDLAATMTPAREVGGDLYDFFWLDRRRFFLMVGDVAGKGLSASIFMAVSKALCKSTMLRSPAGDIGSIMSQANDEVSRDNPEMLFVTAFAGVLDLDTGELAYCNAGHENPFVVHPADSVVRRIEAGGGPPLCVLGGFDYRGARYRMRPGELLCIVSDGVTEAQDPAGRLYGSERVGNVLAGLRSDASSAQSVVERLRAETAAFCDGSDPVDDATVLALRWNGP